MHRHLPLTLALIACGCAGSSPDEAGGPGDSGRDRATLRCPSGSFPEAWPDGQSCSTESPITVHQYDANTFILRQSLCKSFEGPFLYLLFGKDKVLLEDTGAGGIAIREKVDELIAAWLKKNKQQSIKLVVVNSHKHGDHTAGNSQFAGRPNTELVGVGETKVKQFFGFTSWPTQVVGFDLGKRVLDVIPIPGHDCTPVSGGGTSCSDLAFYDRATGLLLTGDSVYAGRLFIRDFEKYRASIERLVTFTATSQHKVCAVLGTHIEMTKQAGVQFELGAVTHPNEHALPLTRDHLVELQSAIDAMQSAPKQEVHSDFVVFPL